MYYTDVCNVLAINMQCYLMPNQICVRYIDFVIITYISNVCNIELIIWQRNEGLLY